MVTDQPDTLNQLRSAGLARLRASEDAASVARDLRNQGLSAETIGEVFDAAALRQKRSAIVIMSLGIALSLITIFLVWGAREAGFTCSGPGLLAGVVMTLKGALKLKNGIEIARAGKAT